MYSWQTSLRCVVAATAAAAADTFLSIEFYCGFIGAALVAPRAAAVYSRSGQLGKGQKLNALKLNLRLSPARCEPPVVAKCVSSERYEKFRP